MAACVEKIVNLVADCVINYVKHHGAYVIRYKNKVLLLEQETKKLGEKRERIQGMVDIATNNGKVIEIEVSSWLKDVEEMERDIANFLHLQENRESFKCFVGCKCPNLKWRHKMGKKADERKPNVIELISKGDRLEKSPVAREAPFQWEPQFDSSQYYTMFNSRALVFDQIMEALKDSRVDMIGVHGPGGSGKTTMVKEVAKEAKKLGIFVKILIAVVSKDPNISKLQEELAPQLDMRYEQRSDSGRADELRKALLNRKKILVILDDLWQGLDLNAIGIPILGPGHRGCTILLTSRREEVFKRMNVHSYFSIGYLEEQEAWELFTKVIGDFGVDELIARKISKRCGGLPIAIVAVGAALKDEEEFEWHNALHKLKNSPLKYIEGIDPVGYTPLKWSYEFLKDEDAKSCFLLCCLFPEDVDIDIDDLVSYSFALGFLRRVDTLKVAKNIVQAMVKKLKKSCLLLNGAGENFVKMHDVIRDLAISITEEKQTEQRGDHDWPGQQQFIVDHDIRKWPKNDAWEHHTAISLRINEDNICFPSGVLNCPQMHTLVLDLRGYSLKIPHDFFEGMEEARVLDFKSLFLELPSSILELDHLQMLRTTNCQLSGDLSTIRNLKDHIKILSFARSSIEALPQEIGELTHLRSLDLRYCKELMVIPKGVISNLIHLEQLYVGNSFEGWDTTVNGGETSNASIAELKSLSQLIILHVSISVESSRIMAQECPDLFEKLINFVIFINCPSTYVNRLGDALIIENIDHIDDKFRPLMNKARQLLLRNIHELRYLSGNPQLQFTPCGQASFSTLTRLLIYDCKSMKYLFSLSCARVIQQLRYLEVTYCSNMEQIIGVVDHHHKEEVVTNEAIIVSRLESLLLRKLPKLRSFYPRVEKTAIEGSTSNCAMTVEAIFNEKVSFPFLTYLLINGLPVENIWNKQVIQYPEGSIKAHFSQLKEVEVLYCDNLTSVFPSNMLPQLQNLVDLVVSHCPSLKLLVEELNPNIQSATVKYTFSDVFPKLRSLALHNLPKLMKTWLSDEDYSFDNSINLYLEGISIEGCDSLRHVFSTFVARHLGNITRLCVKACPGIEVIVSEPKEEGETDDGTIKFRKLKKLALKDLSNFKSFYKSKFEAPHLFNYQDACPNTNTLYLGDFKGPKEIQLWNLIALGEHLHNLCLTRCQVSTKVLSHHVERSFRMIHLEDCQGFKHVIDFDGRISIGEEQFVDVERLKLDNLSELVSLQNKNLHEIGGFRILKYINITKCPQMKSLLTHSMTMTLQHLKKLVVESCEMMEEIIVIGENNIINIVEEEKAAWQIEFSKLEYLILTDLPSLRNFCNDKRCSFNFSSLRGISAKNCPEMKTFVSGQICLPPRMMRAVVGDKDVEITNLNAYLEARNEDNNHTTKIIHWGNDFNENELYETDDSDDAEAILEDSDDAKVFLEDSHDDEIW